jgi:hypothetical protein
MVARCLLLTLFTYTFALAAAQNAAVQYQSKVVALGTCAPFQLFDTPVQQVTSQQCGAFRDSACCDYGTAYRATKWAQQDDGCGVLKNPACQQFINELSCHLACAPGMVLRDRRVQLFARIG